MIYAGKKTETFTINGWIDLNWTDKLNSVKQMELTWMLEMINRNALKWTELNYSELSWI